MWEEDTPTGKHHIGKEHIGKEQPIQKNTDRYRRALTDTGEH